MQPKSATFGSMLLALLNQVVNSGPFRFSGLFILSVFFSFSSLAKNLACRMVIAEMATQQFEGASVRLPADESIPASDHLNMVVPWALAPRVESSQLTDRNYVAKRRSDGHLDHIGRWDGLGWISLETATLHGQKVFIKTSKAFVPDAGTKAKKASEWRELHEFEAETFWVQFLSHHGFGPEFHGTIQTNGHPSIITSYAPGVHIYAVAPSEKLAALEPAARAKAIQRLKEFRTFVRKHQIALLDFQFRVAKDGSIKVLDPEKFRFTDSEFEILKSEEVIDSLIAGF